MSDLFSDLPKTRAEALKIGSTYYFTGKPCKHGHIDKRYVVGRCCYACKVEQQNANRDYYSNYRKENKKKADSYFAKYYIDNRKSKLLARKKYYSENRESISNNDKARYASKVGKTPEELGTRRTPDPARYVYFLVVKDSETNEKLFLKVGITNNPTYRLKQHKRHLAAVGLMFDTILIKDFETEEAAREVEYKIKNSFIVYESDITGFKSECFMYLPQFEESMLRAIDNNKKGENELQRKIEIC